MKRKWFDSVILEFHFHYSEYFLSFLLQYYRPLSKSYAISAGNPATLEAAEVILENGGNAVDAAISAYFASFVAEPCMASIGAGGFAMVSDNQRSTLIDFFCQTPVTKVETDSLEFYPITIDFGTTTEDFHVGKGSCATPGAIAGIFKMHELWGSIPLRDLAAQAISFARDGVMIDTFQSYDISLLAEIFKLSEEGVSLLFQNGSPKQDGDTIKMVQYADFLDVLVHEGQDLFYKGEIARTIANDFKGQGGNLTYEDFTNYEAIVRKPISIKWQDHRVESTPYPSAGGALTSAFLHEFTDKLDRLPEHLSNEHFERLKRTFGTINGIKDDTRKISDYLSRKLGVSYPSSSAAHKWGGTSHFNIVDKNGLAVALTTSIGEGCGYFIPGTDMQMNNMLGESALLPEGFHSWSTDTRLRSMMTPTIIRDKSGTIRLVTGSGGAGRIPFAIAQIIINNILYDQPIHQSVQNPRIHITNESINVERGYSIENKSDVTIWNDPSLYFGGVHSIAIRDSKLSAAGDNRRHGVSINK